MLKNPGATGNERHKMRHFSTGHIFEKIKQFWEIATVNQENVHENEVVWKKLDLPFFTPDHATNKKNHMFWEMVIISAMSINGEGVSMGRVIEIHCWLLRFRFF